MAARLCIAIVLFPTLVDCDSAWSAIQGKFETCGWLVKRGDVLVEQPDSLLKPSDPAAIPQPPPEAKAAYCERDTMMSYAGDERVLKLGLPLAIRSDGREGVLEVNPTVLFKYHRAGEEYLPGKANETKTPEAALAMDFPIECTYVANTSSAELESHARCAARVGAGLQISREHLGEMSYTTSGLASALIDGRWFYVKPNGDLLPVLTYDNGADYFSEGLTRSRVRGKIAYFDSRFHLVIPPKYDWGWPFEGGRALVCIGCKPSKVQDEHGLIEGGKWGFIDRSGKEIVPVNLTQDEVSR